MELDSGTKDFEFQMLIKKRVSVERCKSLHTRTIIHLNFSRKPVWGLLYRPVNATRC